MVLELLAFVTLLQGGDPDFRWHGVVAAGKTVEIRGINGDIRAEPASGREVEVIAEKSGRRLDNVEIKVTETSDGVLVCARYPESRGDRCDSDSDGDHYNSNNFGRERDDVEVTFTVRIPAGVRFVGRTVMGDVTATDLDADASVSTVNGSVDVSTKGRAEASAVNGSVHARMGTLGTGNLEFSTVNGDIDVTVPANAALDVAASNINGNIESDFEMTVRGRVGPRSFHGTIGGGGRSLSMTTVNGNIDLHKGS